MPLLTSLGSHTQSLLSHSMGHTGHSRFSVGGGYTVACTQEVKILVHMAEGDSPPLLLSTQQEGQSTPSW